jgi:RHS repeat-associated protein
MVSKLLSKPSKVNSYYFSGRRYDESGLYYFRHRHYDPSLGRFMQAEPKPHLYLTNLYTYAMNNPINLRDPYGLCGGDPGGIQAPDPQISGFQIFAYQKSHEESFKILSLPYGSISLPLNFPYIPSYFYNNFEDFLILIAPIAPYVILGTIAMWFLIFAVSKVGGWVQAPEPPGTESPFIP